MNPKDVLVELIYQANQQNVDLGKKRFQKLVYLLKAERGVSLHYPFGIHYYGPFSPAVAKDLDLLASDFIVQMNRGVSGTHSITVNTSKISKETTVSDAVKAAITEIIQKYGHIDLAHLEVYTIAHLLYHQGDIRDPEALLKQVKALKDSKGDDICRWAVKTVIGDSSSQE